MSLTSVNLTIEQFQKLLAVCGQASAPRSASFATAKFSYSGERDPTVVKIFLATASCFKQVEKLSDEVALKSLPLILKDDAAIWWYSISESVSTWTAFKDRLQRAFAPKKPAHQIYQELIGVHQKENEMTVIFVIQKRDLITQLPTPALPENHQIDMVYGTLHKKIKEKIARESVETFDDLLEAVQFAEDPFEETSWVPKRKRVRCGFCKNPGHTQYECRKKLAEEESASASQPAISQPSPASPTPYPRFSCFGCGAPEVVRSNCSTCANRVIIPPFKREEIKFC